MAVFVAHFSVLFVRTKHLVAQLTNLVVNSCPNLAPIAFMHSLLDLLSSCFSFTADPITNLFAQEKQYFCRMEISHSPLCQFFVPLSNWAHLFLFIPLAPYPRTKSCPTFITWFQRRQVSETCLLSTKFAQIIFAAEKYVTVKSKKIIEDILYCEMVPKHGNGNMSRVIWFVFENWAFPDTGSDKRDWQ